MRQILFLVSLLFSTTLIFAGERINAFDSYIKVKTDASIEVLERITVTSENKQIKRGIVRWLPLNVGDYEIVSIKKNGQSENFHTAIQKNHKVIYVGSKDVYLKPGTYEYSILYKTKNQVRFFKDYDEIYWNVTGNGWAFPIDNVQATVQLPKAAKISRSDAYTGVFGSTQQNYEKEVLNDNTMEFRSTTSLGPKHGMTVAVGWQKGIVIKPTKVQLLYEVIAMNPYFKYGLILFVFLFVFSIASWLKVGRDPIKGVIMPRYEPPEGIAPGTMRFITRMGFDNRIISCAIISMATKGVLEIDEKNNKYELIQAPGASTIDLSVGEKVLFERLFKANNKIKLDRECQERLKTAFENYQDTLEKEYVSLYFNTNSGYMWIAYILGILIVGLQALTSTERNVGIFLTVWLSIWSVGTFGLIKACYIELRAFISSKSFNTGMRFFASAMMSIVYTAGWCFGLSMLYMNIPWINFILMVCTFATVSMLHVVIKQPTRQGRILLDHIEGFKLFLEKTEKYALEKNAPKVTSVLYEKYLPYAIALDVDTNWSRYFTDVIAKSQEIQSTYHPSWYRGSNWSTTNCRVFSSAIAAGIASSAIASTTTSSGSGGGGFSGGGGGGGGGGGW